MKALAKSANKQIGKALSHRSALSRIAQKIVSPGAVIDIGAARGAWSVEAMRHWPDARYHLLEAKELWQDDLEKLAARKTSLSYSLKAVSDEPGEIFFPKDGEAYAGAAFKDENARSGLTAVPATTIDHEIEDFQLKGPFALKLDTHGTEVDILKGASKALADTHLICIETYNYIGQKRFPEMLLYLQELGFRVSDIAEPLFRASDASLWQLDFYLLRADHPSFQDYGFA